MPKAWLGNHIYQNQSISEIALPEVLIVKARPLLKDCRGTVERGTGQNYGKGKEK